MRRSIIAFAVVLFSTIGCTNLTWIGDKTYAPAATATLDVAGLGVNDSVDILPPGAAPVATRAITNDSSVAAPGGYEVTDVVTQWVFTANTGSYGFSAGDPATHTVFSGSAVGPALAPGQTQSLSFGPMPPLACGLYQETLTIDVGGDVVESNEADNSSSHFFFVPSDQQFAINVTTLTSGINHDAGDTPTHIFNIVPLLPTASWTYAHFTFVATEGSTAYTDPAPPVPAPGGPGGLTTITMHVVPKEHKIPSLGFQPTVTGKVTLISEDGCVIRQRTARVFVEHEQD